MAIISSEVLPEIEKWRRVLLGSPDGMEVLSELLTELHVFDTVQSEQEVALQNFGKWILYRLGIYTDNNIYEIVAKLAEVEYNKGEEK